MVAPHIVFLSWEILELKRECNDQVSRYKDKNVCPVLALLINVAIDWTRWSVAMEAASNTDR